MSRATVTEWVEKSRCTPWRRIGIAALMQTKRPPRLATSEAVPAVEQPLHLCQDDAEDANGRTKLPRLLVSHLLLFPSERLYLHRTAHVKASLEPRIVLDRRNGKGGRVGDGVWSNDEQLLRGRSRGGHANGSFVMNEAVGFPMIENGWHDKSSRFAVAHLT
jgi:hypothetical protein